MDDSALKEFTNVDAEDPNNALGDLNSEEVADVGLKINVNKIKKDDPLKDEKEENNKTYNEEDTSLILSNDIYQDTDVKATGNKEQAGVDASATGHVEMGGYGAVAPNNLGGYGAAPKDLGGYGATNIDMGGYGSSAATLGAMEQQYQVQAQNLGGYGAYVPPSDPGNMGGYGESDTDQSKEAENAQPRREEGVNQNMAGSTFVEVDKRRCYKCGEVGHMANTCPNVDSTLKCFVCKKTGHMAKNCPETKCYACGKRGHMATQCPNPIPKHLREDFNQGSWNRGSYDRPRLYNDHGQHGITGRTYQGGGRDLDYNDYDNDGGRDGYNERNNGRAPDNSNGDGLRTDGDADANEYSRRSRSRERSRERSQGRYRESSRSRGRSAERPPVYPGDNENNNQRVQIIVVAGRLKSPMIENKVSQMQWAVTGVHDGVKVPDRTKQDGLKMAVTTIRMMVVAKMDANQGGLRSRVQVITPVGKEIGKVVEKQGGLKATMIMTTILGVVIIESEIDRVTQMVVRSFAGKRKVANGVEEAVESRIMENMYACSIYKTYHSFGMIS